MTENPDTEPANATVDDWHGQEVDREEKRADEALQDAGGDEEEAALRFESGSAGS